VFQEGGPRVVELFAPDGRRLLRRVSRGPLLLAMPGSGVHLLRVSGAEGAVTRRIVAP
jgi:hypothetical protein